MSASRSHRHDGNDFVNRWVFRCRRNDDRVDAAVTVGGRLFQVLVPTAEKDRSPSAVSPLWILLEQSMTMVVVTTRNWSYETIKAPVKSSPPTNQHPAIYRPDVLPVVQPTVSEH